MESDPWMIETPGEDVLIDLEWAAMVEAGAGDYQENDR